MLFIYCINQYIFVSVKYQMKSVKPLRAEYGQPKPSLRRTLQNLSVVNLEKQSEVSKLKASLISQKFKHSYSKPLNSHKRVNSQMTRSITSMVLSKKMAQLSNLSNDFCNARQNDFEVFKSKNKQESNRQTRKLFTFCNVSVKQQQVSIQNHLGTTVRQKQHQMQQWQPQIQQLEDQKQHVDNVNQSATKVLISKQQLRRFTQKFAKQKVQYQQRLQDYRSIKQSMEMIKVQNSDLKECLDFKQQQYGKLHALFLETSVQRDQISRQLLLKNEQYSNIVTSYDLKIKQLQTLKIYIKQLQAKYAKSELQISRQSGASSSMIKHPTFNIPSQMCESIYAEDEEAADQHNLVSILRIQNQHFRRQYQLSKEELRNISELFKQKCQQLQQRIVILSQENEVLIQKCLRPQYIQKQIRKQHKRQSNLNSRQKQNMDLQNQIVKRN